MADLLLWLRDDCVPLNVWRFQGNKAQTACFTKWQNMKIKVQELRIFTNQPAKGKNTHQIPVESNKCEANKVKPCLGVQHKQIGEFPLFQNVSFPGIQKNSFDFGLPTIFQVLQQALKGACKPKAHRSFLSHAGQCNPSF